MWWRHTGDRAHGLGKRGGSGKRALGRFSDARAQAGDARRAGRRSSRPGGGRPHWRSLRARADMKRASRVSDDRVGDGTRPTAVPEQTEVETLRVELQRERDRLLRTKADFDNYRRRAEREREVAGRQGRRDL